MPMRMSYSYKNSVPHPTNITEQCLTFIEWNSSIQTWCLPTLLNRTTEYHHYHHLNMSVEWTEKVAFEQDWADSKCRAQTNPGKMFIHRNNIPSLRQSLFLIFFIFQTTWTWRQLCTIFEKYNSHVCSNRHTYTSMHAYINGRNVCFLRFVCGWERTVSEVE